MRIFGLICIAVGLTLAVVEFLLVRPYETIVRANCGPFSAADCPTSPNFTGVLIGLALAGFGILLLAIRPHKKKTIALSLFVLAGCTTVNSLKPGVPRGVYESGFMKTTEGLLLMVRNRSYDDVWAATEKAATRPAS